MPDVNAELDDFLRQRDEQREGGEARLHQRQERARQYIATVAYPALEECKETLQAHRRDVQLSRDDYSVTIDVRYDGRREVQYTLQANVNDESPALRGIFRATLDGEWIKGEDAILNHAGNSSIAHITGEDVARAFLRLYKEFAH